jgi:hypothetical protein
MVGAFGQSGQMRSGNNLEALLGMADESEFGGA